MADIPPSDRNSPEDPARVRAELIAALSHDLRNPLNAIMGAVQILELGVLTDFQKHQLQIVMSSCETMLEVLERVVTMSRQAEGGTG